MVDYFKFENQDEDLPFYTGETKLSLKGALLLFACLVLFILPIVFPIPMGDIEFALFLCFVLVVPTVFLLRGHLNLLFKTIKPGNLKIVVLCVVFSLVYSFLMLFILSKIGIANAEPLEETLVFDLTAVISMIFQLMGEELFKILTFLLSMFVLYRFSNNRKVSLVISLVIAMASFGLLHGGFYGSFLQVFMIQGLGSIFDFYAYLKTRNVFVSYMAHLIFDLLLTLPNAFF